MEEQPSGKTLHSWKEIASHLGVAVRSVQRWEKQAGLPVYRQGSGAKARVFAYAEELDQWLASGGEARGEAAAPPGFRHRRMVFYGAASLAVLGVILIYLGVFSQRALPRGWTIEGSTLAVLDADGQVCWRKALPGLSGIYRGFVRDKVVIADIDQDGRIEVLLNFSPLDPSSRSSSLMCFEESGNLRWEFRYGAAKTFGSRDFEPVFVGQIAQPVRVQGKSYVLAVSNHHLWYPSQAALLDVKTGRMLEEYWHPGSMYDCVLADVDHDGADEAILSAINNPGEGLGHAALAVLKIPFSKAPKRSVPPQERFPALTGGGELAYVLFPLTDVSKFMGQLPIPGGLQIHDDGIAILTPQPESGGIVYYLDFDLHVKEYRFSDNFAALHNRLHRQHLLDHPLTNAEKESMGRVASFPAAPDGNSPDLARFWRF